MYNLTNREFYNLYGYLMGERAESLLQRDEDLTVTPEIEIMTENLYVSIPDGDFDELFDLIGETTPAGKLLQKVLDSLNKTAKRNADAADKICEMLGVGE